MSCLKNDHFAGKVAASVYREAVGLPCSPVSTLLSCVPSWQMNSGRRISVGPIPTLIPPRLRLWGPDPLRLNRSHFLSAPFFRRPIHEAQKSNNITAQTGKFSTMWDICKLVASDCNCPRSKKKKKNTALCRKQMAERKQTNELFWQTARGPNGRGEQQEQHLTVRDDSHVGLLSQ